MFYRKVKLDFYVSNIPFNVNATNSERKMKTETPKTHSYGARIIVRASLRTLKVRIEVKETPCFSTTLEFSKIKDDSFSCGHDLTDTSLHFTVIPVMAQSVGALDLDSRFRKPKVAGSSPCGNCSISDTHFRNGLVISSHLKQ